MTSTKFPMYWTWRRKAAILDALDAGTTTPVELDDTYGITADELAAWQHARANGGDKALRATKPRPRPPKLRKRRATPGPQGTQT